MTKRTQEIAMHRTNRHTGTKSRILAGAFAAFLASAGAANAAFVEGTRADDLLFGLDDDNQENTQIQPAGAVNQSLGNTDIIEGGNGDDVMIGLAGSDVLIGGKGDDILVGGTEQGVAPNSDAMLGNDGNDTALWRGGDGSEPFVGGSGKADALIMGNIDRDASNVPVISATTGRHSATGIPTADVTGQGGFCTLERVQDADAGYEFLVRFFVRATGNLAVTMRTVGVEEVYCTSEIGGQITFADLTAGSPEFAVVSLGEIEEINPTVARIIR
ncbi:MAG: hypothetical protein ACREQJ_06690 [Candidatus Binatia bacterium]